jgi:hypothetical protein
VETGLTDGEDDGIESDTDDEKQEAGKEQKCV